MSLPGRVEWMRIVPFVMLHAACLLVVVVGLALGEMADALLLASTRVAPKELKRTGYVFRQPTLEESLRHLLGKP